MKSSDDVLLDGDSLKRHFDFVNPELIKIVKFKITNKYNEFKNKEPKSRNDINDAKAVKEIAQDIKEENQKSKDTKQNPMDLVAKGIILGVIPKSVQIEAIIEEAKKSTNPVKSIHIFSVTDEFEQGMPGMLQPHQLEELQKKHGIEFKHHQVPMTDFGAEITPQALLAAVYKMRQIIEEGGTVYIHCKAGRARSAMIVATYLALFGDNDNLKIKENDDANPSLNQAVQYLKNKRTQVDLHQDKVTDWKQLMQQKSGVAKLQKAQEAINLHKALVLELKIKGNTTLKTKDYISQFNECTANKWKGIHWDKPPTKKVSRINKLIDKIMKKPSWQFNTGHSPLSTLEFKNDLINLASFKQLKIYATQSQNLLKRTSKRTNYVNQFLKQIYEAKNDNWFIELQNKKGPLWKLYTNSKATADIKVIIDSFIKDIEKYQEEKVKVNKNDAQMQIPITKNESMNKPPPEFDLPPLNNVKISKNQSSLFYSQSESRRRMHLLKSIEKQYGIDSDVYKKAKPVIDAQLKNLKENKQLTPIEMKEIKDLEQKVAARTIKIIHK